MQKNLEARGYTVKAFAAAAEAAAYLDGAIDGRTVGLGGSGTLKAMGIYDAAGGPQHVLWHWKQAADRPGGRPCGRQVYLTSANALAETGEIINIDGVGNRLAGTLFGHEKVYFVIGRNKLAPTYDEGRVAGPERGRRPSAPSGWGRRPPAP